MIKSDEKKIVAGSLIAIGLVFSVIAAFTDCSAGGADNYAHFNIARWAFRYPNLFLDHWGKPVFTILIAPFTQLGFFGARLFNIIAGLLTAWICYLLVFKWKLRKAWLIPVFVIFAPMYFIFMFSGMTEILFSLVLILAIWLFYSERMILSAIALSFIILIRSEGFIFLPIFFTAFALKKKFTAIPFLLFGFTLFSLIGLIYYYHDFMWLINKLPYVGGQKGIYGSGPWYHFLINMPDYLGYLIIFLFLTGVIFWIIDWIKSRFRIDSDQFYRLFIPGTCFFGYLAAHSFMWWKGDNASLGLIRVMVGVTPVAGIFALAGYSKLDSFIHRDKLKIAFLISTVLLVIIPGVLRYQSAFSPDPQSIVIDKVVGWLKETNNLRCHLIVHNPYMAFSAKVDAWDQKIIQYGFSDVNYPEVAMPDSSIFIWDAHFSQNEGRMPASKILENPYFELIAYFEPEIPFKVLNGYDYNIMVFRKVNSRSVDNLKVLNSLKENATSGNLLYSELIDYNTSVPDKIAEKFRVAVADSVGNYYYRVGPENEFSSSILLTVKQVNITNQISVKVNFDFFMEEVFAINEALMVFSVEKDCKPYNYQGVDILQFHMLKDRWNHASFIFSMPDVVKPETVIKLYIWDTAKKKLRIDNFSVKVFSRKDI